MKGENIEYLQKHSTIQQIWMSRFNYLKEAFASKLKGKHAFIRISITYSKIL